MRAARRRPSEPRARCPTSVKFALYSFTLYPEGFNACDSVAKSDALYAIHVGDYLYEYGAASGEFGNDTAAALGRCVVPANDIAGLSDYRTRYALYRSDPTLQALHAKMPWSTVWDDHEFANNAFVGGAENHDPSTQGDWTARKTVAAEACRLRQPLRAAHDRHPHRRPHAAVRVLQRPVRRAGYRDATT